MKNKVVKLASLAVAAGMLTSIVACGKPAEAPKTSASTPAATAAATAKPAADPAKPWLADAEKPYTIDWYVDENWYTRAKWGKDLTSQYITKKTGVSVNIIIPTGDNTAKRTAMIASGDLPDVMSMGNWYPEWRKMQDSGMLWSFQELAEKYDPKMLEVLRPSLLNYYKAADGKNYVYPNSGWNLEDYANAQYLQSSYALSVKKDMYEAIGKPDMTTPEGFLNALKLAKEKFPNVNGQPLIPYMIGSEFNNEGTNFFNDTLPRLLNIPYEKDGKFYKYGYQTDADYMTWMKTMRKAFELGYITKDQFTDKDAQIKDKIKAGRVFATTYAANTMRQIAGEFYAKDPNTTYIPVEGIQNAKKEKAKLPAGGLSGWQVNMITKKAKDPARVAKFFHYWLSDEGQEDFWFGDPSMYEMKNGKKWMKDDIYSLRDKNEQEFCLKYGGRDNYFMLLQSPTGDKFKQNVPDFEKPFYDFCKGRVLDTSVWQGNDPDATTPGGIEFVKSKNLWGQLLPKALTAKNDAELEGFIKDYITANEKAAAVYLPEMEAKMNAKKKLLNVK